MILRARVVLPVSQPPIEDGAIFVSGDKILNVGRWADLRSSSSDEVVDLGEVVLMPGLINAHCHLELTSLAGKIFSGGSFTQWVQSILRHREELTENDLSTSWLRGAQMLLNSGTTTIANIESSPAILDQVRGECPLRVHSFLELTGVLSGKRPEEILEDNLQLAVRLQGRENPVGLSPHAPYSVPSELLKLISWHIEKFPNPFCMHLAESEAEWNLFRDGTSDFAGWLSQHRDLSELTGQTPAEFTHKLGLLNENLIAIHANFLTDQDINRISENRVHVVHCPQSHEFFGHAPFRWKELNDAGVNICLGTDSLASTTSPGGQTPSLNLFDEMRLFAKNFPECSAKEVLKMVTVNPAKALQQKTRIGELTSGAFADCLVVDFNGDPTDVFDSLLGDSAEVRNVMFRGKWVN